MAARDHQEHLQIAVRDLLTGIGEHPTRHGLTETPKRVAKAWVDHWASGYGKNPHDLLKSFDANSYDEMVVVKDIPLYSHCEHHLAPIFGTATIAYVPKGRILGLSKLSRLVDIYARRLQVQERLTVQIADSLYGVYDGAMRFSPSPLEPRGVGVMIKARHMCMESRGICQQGHHTVTTALRGVIAQGEPRAEFLAVANK